MNLRTSCFLFFSLLSFGLFAQPILLDGRMGDWSKVEPLLLREPTREFDLTGLWATGNSQRIILRIRLNQTILLQEQNALGLYLDIDGHGATGDLAGAEIAWFFGERKGWIQHGGESLPIEYQALDLYTAPTMQASEFEISISWKAHPWLEKLGAGTHPVGIMLFDKRHKEILCYARFQPTEQKQYKITADLRKEASRHLRLVSHNVNRRHFHPDKREAFSSVYQALSPDILLLQEAYEGSAEEILEYFRPALDSTRTWYAGKAGEEATVVLSPYRFRSVTPLGNSAAYLLDLRPHYDADLALVVLSLPCCRQDSARQAEADRIAALVRDWTSPGGKVTLPAGTPIVLMGDANLVGPEAPYRTLLEGAIQDTLTYGPRFLPDWDGSALTDLHPRQLLRPVTATWRGESFSPGRLDFVFYSDSSVGVGRRFVFDATGMPESLLSLYGLQGHDGAQPYFHMPVVADLILFGKE